MVNDSPMLSLQLRTSYGEEFDGDLHDSVLKPSVIATLNKVMSKAEEKDCRVLESMLHSLERMKINEMTGKSKPSQVYHTSPKWLTLSKRNASLSFGRKPKLRTNQTL